MFRSFQDTLCIPENKFTSLFSCDVEPALRLCALAKDRLFVPKCLIVGQVNDQIWLSMFGRQRYFHHVSCCFP